MQDKPLGDAVKGKHRERDTPNLAKRATDGEEVEIDKSKLRKALDEERKRKGMGDDEAWAQSKKTKTDITQEELGELLPLCRSGQVRPYTFFPSVFSFVKSIGMATFASLTCRR